MTQIEFSLADFLSRILTRKTYLVPALHLLGAKRQRSRTDHNIAKLEPISRNWSCQHMVNFTMLSID